MGVCALWSVAEPSQNKKRNSLPNSGSLKRLDLGGAMVKNGVYGQDSNAVVDGPKAAELSLLSGTYWLCNY